MPNLFLTPDARKFAFGEPPHSGVYVLPSHKSDDPQFLHFMETLHKNTQHIQPEVDEDGFADASGITKDSEALLSVSGYAQRPLTFLPSDNTQLRESIGLTDRWADPEHRAITEEVAALMFSTWRETGLRVPKHSQSCFPYFTYDTNERVAIFRYFVANWDDIRDLILRDDLVTLWSRHEIAISYFMGWRLQPEKISKKREVNDKLYALTGGRSGERRLADKTVVTNDGRVIAGHTTMRGRTICGMAWAVNSALQCLFAGFRAHYADEFAFSFHHTTPEAIGEKIQKYNFVQGVDAHQFDQSVWCGFFDVIEAQIASVTDPGFAKLFRMASHAPYYQRPVGPKSADGELAEHGWVGNPLKTEDFSLNGGLMSGIANVSDMGKFVMTSVYLIMLNEIFGDVRKFGIARILRGEHPEYAILDQGDDCVVLYRDEWAFKRGVEYVKSLSCPYVQLEPEEGISFLGNVIAKDESGKLRILPNAMSWLINTLCPERGVGTKLRRNWHLGYDAKILLFGKAPKFKELHDIMIQTWRATMWGVPTPDQQAKDYVPKVDSEELELLNAQRNLIPDLDYPSLQVLLKHDLIYYRYDPETIDPRVLAFIIDEVKSPEVERFVRRIFFGTYEMK